MALGLRFEWDREKAAANAVKHGVSFVEAITAFGDPLSLTIADPDHSDDEVRYVLIGRTHSNRLVVVAHTEREDLRPEYDFSGGVRGKYAKRFAEGSNVVVLEPDVAERFPNSEAVNRALRKLISDVATTVKRGE